MKYKLRLNLEWEIEGPDDDGDTDITRNEVLEVLNDLIISGNETVDNLFWEGIEVIPVPDDEDDFAPSIVTIINNEEE